MLLNIHFVLFNIQHRACTWHLRVASTWPSPIYNKKCTFLLTFNVFSMKALIYYYYFTIILFLSLQLEMGPLFYMVIWSSYAKGRSLAVQMWYLHFLVILRLWVLVWPWKSNPRPPTLQLSTLPAEPILTAVVIKNHNHMKRLESPTTDTQKVKWITFVTH